MTNVVVKVLAHTAARNAWFPVRNTPSLAFLIRIPFEMLTDTVPALVPKLMKALAVPSFEMRTQVGPMFVVEVVPIEVVTVCPTPTTTSEIVAEEAPPTVIVWDRPIGMKAKFEAISGSPLLA